MQQSFEMSSPGKAPLSFGSTGLLFPPTVQKNDPFMDPKTIQRAPLMVPMPPHCIAGRFKQRRNRFLVEIDHKGESLWVHTNNSGSMLGLLRPEAPVLVSPSPNKNRKLSHTLEMVGIQDFWVGVNTSVPNRVLHEAWRQGVLPQANGYEQFQSERKVLKSRFDALLRGSQGTLWVESKNVTLVEDEVAYFPDAVTTRGQKHLQELMALKSAGRRCACFYLIQRPDASCFAPADFIDPVFADLFWQAVAAGVEMWVYEALVHPDGIRLGRTVPLRGTVHGSHGTGPP